MISVAREQLAGDVCGIGTWESLLWMEAVVQFEGGEIRQPHVGEGTIDVDGNAAALKG